MSTQGACFWVLRHLEGAGLWALDNLSHQPGSPVLVEAVLKPLLIK
jgi:hypothetical protein